MAVGEVIPSEYFHAKAVAVDATTHENIDALSVVLNEDFGITCQDLIATHKRKVLHYVTNYDNPRE